MFIPVDDTDEMNGGVIGGVLGAVGGVLLVAIIFTIICWGIRKQWDNTMLKFNVCLTI